MEEKSRELLVASLHSLGLSSSPESIAAVLRHLEMVADWNTRMNLTSITDEREMILKHAVDAASALMAVEVGKGTRVLDVGSGAGFPGVTLKCLCPQIDMVLLDTVQKKCRFLEAVGEAVVGGAEANRGYEVLWGRAEDLGQNLQYREQFDIVVARAVSELRVLSEFCLPFCRVGGIFLAMKGPSACDEIEAAKEAITQLGGAIGDIRMVTLPGGVGERALIKIQKIRSTPRKFPRKAGVPAKSPLGG